MRKKYEYTLEDCACKYCLYYSPIKQACKIETCCCLEEKRIAIPRFRADRQESNQWAG